MVPHLVFFRIGISLCPGIWVQFFTLATFLMSMVPHLVFFRIGIFRNKRNLVERAHERILFGLLRQLIIFLQALHSSQSIIEAIVESTITTSIKSVFRLFFFHLFSFQFFLPLGLFLSLLLHLPGHLLPLFDGVKALLFLLLLLLFIHCFLEFSFKLLWGQVFDIFHFLQQLNSPITITLFILLFLAIRAGIFVLLFLFARILLLFFLFLLLIFLLLLLFLDFLFLLLVRI